MSDRPSADYDRLREWAETPACPWPTDRWESVEVAMLALLDEIESRPTASGKGDS